MADHPLKARVFDLRKRQALRDAAFPTQVSLGWSFPNAVMQYAVPDLENLSIDIAALSRRRDRFNGQR